MAVLTVDTDDLVTIGMVAERLSATVGKSTVTMWPQRRATNDFPKPVIELTGEKRPVRLYSWTEVLAWLSAE